MTERLTEKTDEGIWVKESHGDNVMKTLYRCYGAEPLPNYSNCDEGYSGMEKLNKYENAEEEGRLVVLPCKVGDMVYVIAPNHRLCEAKHDCDEYDYENYLISWCEKFCPYGYKGIGVIKDIISHIEIRDNGICYCTTNCGYLYDDKVFLTREEAEKALKEMEGKA